MVTIMYHLEIIYITASSPDYMRVDAFDQPFAPTPNGTRHNSTVVAGRVGPLVKARASSLESDLLLVYISADRKRSFQVGE